VATSTALDIGVARFGSGCVGAGTDTGTTGEVEVKLTSTSREELREGPELGKRLDALKFSL